MRDSTDAAKSMPMLRRADHLCIVIDGKKLTDTSQRHSGRTDARMLLRSIIDAGVLSRKCKIEILFSKWDLVPTDLALESLMSFISDTKRELQDVAGKVMVPQFFEVAARPENTKLPFAFGLPTLLRYWLEEPTVPRVKLYVPQGSPDAREAVSFAQAVVQTQRLQEFYDVQWV